MAFRIKIENKQKNWYQIFPDDEIPSEFIAAIRNQGATFYEDGSFECEVYDIQPIIASIELYVKKLQKVFNTRNELRKRIEKHKKEMNEGVYSVIPNSIFDLTNDFVPLTHRNDSGYDLNPTWRIIELYGLYWPMFMSYNFIKFIEQSIVRTDILSFALKEGEKLRICGKNEE